MQKQVYARPDLCIGCRMCANACALVHWGICNPRLGAIRIKQNAFEGYEYQSLCRHCSEPACLEACIAGCITKDARTGIVTNDPDRCVGCWACVMSCPYDAISRDRRNGVAIRCDQCAGRSVPACVEVCPTGALVFAEREEAQV